ncbi:hypothetical protein [Marmoricola sp. RAF53]|uniref:hypothetical protein n=1 Tax=Marmoricola sp. RAF53 TaxID=3233059 RepID=UPI003F986CD4
MVISVVALTVLAFGCALYLVENVDSTRSRSHRRPVIDLTTAMDPEARAWQGAALNARGDTRLLQYAIVAALDSDEHPRREAILRSALRETRAPVDVAL